MADEAEDLQAEYAAMRKLALEERKVGPPVSVERVRIESGPIEFDIDPRINQYQ